MKIIFILYNIFEVKSGVSNKYINFIDYLTKQKTEYLLFTTFSSSNLNNKYNIIYKKGINIPFYNDIKIPNIKLIDLKNYVNDYDIIIFNGEFFWLYTIFNDLKKIYKNVKLIPNWHTNYEYYSKLYFKNMINIQNIKKNLYNNLKNKFFSGIIVTGEITKNNFQEYCSNVFNANEICLDNFNIFEINHYNLSNKINFIYVGRVSIEKNLDLLIDILYELNSKNSQFNNFHMHIIGDGPYKNELFDKINDELINKITFYGSIEYSEIKYIYKNLDNRIFIQPSISETFGKTSMEACYSGIPIFVKSCEIHEILYKESNSFIFDNVNDFKNQLMLFFKLSQNQKVQIINNAYNNAKKYNQNNIFYELKEFLIKLNQNSNHFYKQFFISNVFQGIKCGIDYFES